MPSACRRTERERRASLVDDLRLPDRRDAAERARYVSVDECEIGVRRVPDDCDPVGHDAVVWALMPHRYESPVVAIRPQGVTWQLRLAGASGSEHDDDRNRPGCAPPHRADATAAQVAPSPHALGIDRRAALPEGNRAGQVERYGGAGDGHGQCRRQAAAS